MSPTQHLTWERETDAIVRFFRIILGLTLVLVVYSLGRDPENLKKLGSFLKSQPAGWIYVIGSALIVAPWLKFGRSRAFLFHASWAFLGLACLNLLIVQAVPFSIRDIGPSYLIFFYHFPSALSSYAFFIVCMVASILYLTTQREHWDLCARVAGQIGLVGITISLLTGSVWAKAAWGYYWVWSDARLLTAAIMWLIYAGYCLLPSQIEDVRARRNYVSVFGILACLNIPLVHYAIQWFGQTSHPKKFDDLGSDVSIIITRWLGLLMFVVFYALLYRWRLESERQSDAVERLLPVVRAAEERN